MRREARKRTWRSENFFSSSRVRLGWGLVGGFVVEGGWGGVTVAGLCGSRGGGARGRRRRLLFCRGRLRAVGLEGGCVSLCDADSCSCVAGL